VGIRYVNQVATPGTGRVVGRTPLTVELRPSDVQVLPNGIGNVVCELRLAGFRPQISIIGLGEAARLESGRTYTIRAQLQPL
jgi:hypothetical protein